METVVDSGRRPALHFLLSGFSTATSTLIHFGFLCLDWFYESLGCLYQISNFCDTTFVSRVFLVAQKVKNPPGFDPGVGKIPWKRAWQPTPVLLPGESRGQRSLEGYSPWDRKEWDTTECTQPAYIYKLMSGSRKEVSSREQRRNWPASLWMLWENRG